MVFYSYYYYHYYFEQKKIIFLKGTMFLRAEDAQWHYKTNQIYFTTTDSAVANNGHSKVFEVSLFEI